MNAADHFEETLLSILEQNHPRMEFIVVDGGSTDGTLAIIERYKDKISKIVIEKDRGIYDAMNKATRIATGDYIIFMNSGDQFVHAGSVTALCNCVSGEEVLIYGGWIVKYPWGLERNRRPAPRDQFWRGMFVQHQSVMVRTKYLREHPFELSLSLGADYALLLGIVNQNLVYRECSSQIARVSSGGVSDSNRIEVVRSHWKSARLFYPGIRTDSYYLLLVFRQVLSMTIKRLLPPKWVQAIIDRK